MGTPAKRLGSDCKGLVSKIIYDPLSCLSPGSAHFMSLLAGQPRIAAASPKPELAKFTFRVNHPPSRPQVDDTEVEMFLLGSVKEMGEWNEKRAKRMKRSANGGWEATIYIPKKVDLLYQYLLRDADGNELADSAQNRRKRTDAAEQADHTEINDRWSDGSSEEREPTCSTPSQPSSGPWIPEMNGTQSDQWVSENQGESNRDSVLPLPAFENTKAYLARSSLAACGARGSMSGFHDCLGAGEEAKRRMSVRQSTSGFADCKETLEAEPADEKEPTEEDMLEETAVRLTEVGELVAGEGLRRCLAQPSQGRDKVTLALHALAAAVEKAVAETEEGAAERDALAAEREAFETKVAEMEAELKAAQSDLEEEREKAAMRARRLRGSIRTAQNKVGGVREGFVTFRQEMERMRDAAIPELSSMAGRLEKNILRVTQEVQAERDETLAKFKEEGAERKRLHNLVQELKGNIRVFCRVRPMSGSEKGAGKSVAVMTPTDMDLSLTAAGKITPYHFDKVFGTDSTQDQVFEETAPLVVSVLDGYNICIFAYGQTGSGKTHTMEGSPSDRGVNWRTLHMLFEQANERHRIAKYAFKVSLMEIYNEQIKDLLDSNDANGELKKLEVKSDPATGGTYVPDLHLANVSCIEDVQELVAIGMKNRSTSATNMNAHSSRSHCIFSVHVTCEDLLKGATSFGKMHLIDLAGSERLSRTGATGDRLTEAKNINKSLSALGNCISALAAKQKHVPFRDSRLTHLLQDSLGVESKMLMFVCTSPCDSDATETSCSLQFAARAASVELGTAKKRGDGGAGAILKEAQAGMNEAREKARAADERIERLEEELQKQKARVAAEVSKEDSASREKAQAAADAAAKEKAGRLAAEKEKDNLTKECTALRRRLEKAEKEVAVSKAQSRIAPPPTVRSGFQGKPAASPKPIAEAALKPVAPPVQVAKAVPEEAVVNQEEEAAGAPTILSPACEDKENFDEGQWGMTLPEEFEDDVPPENVESTSDNTSASDEQPPSPKPAEAKTPHGKTPRKTALAAASINANSPAPATLSLDERLARFRAKKRLVAESAASGAPGGVSESVPSASTVAPIKNHALRKTTRTRRPVTALASARADGGEAAEHRRPVTAGGKRGINKVARAGARTRRAVEAGGWR